MSNMVMGQGILFAAELELLGTSGCHLCEEAEALLASLGLRARYIDIAGDDGLAERYGIRIPVLRRADGAELGWPFAAADIASFVGLV